VLFPTPPFWLEKAMNFVLFVASISILFLSFYFRGLPAVLHGRGCHPCTLSGGLDTMPSVRLAVIHSVSRAVIPASIQARPMACLSSCPMEWLPDSVHAVRSACRLECRHAFRLSCNPALRHSALPSGANACKQACVTDSTKKQVIPMHSFNAVVWGICWQCLVGSNRAMLWKSYPYFVKA
jgi:hypothetical protein